MSSLNQAPEFIMSSTKDYIPNFEALNSSSKKTSSRDSTQKKIPNKDDTIKEQKKFKESDAGDGTTREDQILTGSKFYLCVSSLTLCMLLIALDQMITAAVLSVISNHFNEFDKLTWITSAYMVPMGCCAQVWGRLSINFGRKWTLVAGLLLFEIGSLLAGIAVSMNMLILGRAIQGIGGSCIQTVVTIITTEITTIDKRPVLFAVRGLTYVVASVLGPIIGGIFGTYASWRWCFYLNLCCSAIIFPFFILTYRPKMPKTTLREKLKTIDFLDNFFMVSSCVLLLLGLSFGQTSNEWGSVSVISCFVLGGILLIIFIAWNFKYSKYPVIPKKVFFNKHIFICFLIIMMSYSAMMVCIQFLSVYFKNVIGHNAFHTGLSLIPLAVTVSSTSIINGILMKVSSLIKIYSLISVFLLPVAVGLMMLLSTKENLGNSIGFQFLLGASNGLNFQGPFMTAMLHAPKEPGSTILTTAFINFGRSIGTAAFSNISAEIYSSTLRYYLAKISDSLQEKEYPIEEILLRSDLISRMNKHDHELVIRQMLLSIHNVFWMVFAISILTLVTTLFMSNQRLPKQSEVET